LDIKSKNEELMEVEKIDCELSISLILKEEEIKMKQRSREKFITKGDGNTRYFHIKVKVNRRRLRIQALEVDEALVEDEVRVNLVATCFSISTSLSP
jgi:hypothetical protein